MKTLFKVKLGMIAIIVGIIGCMFGVGGVDNAQTVSEWVTVAGVTATSLMLMYLGTLLVKEEI
jgi:ABC-type transporter Mla maintaining outer membrane lipid asymmetry permease subunit MlaE